jgi:hypothetical protein
MFGEEYSLTTLLCIFLSALLTRRAALFFCCTGLCCMVAAAAIENPEAPERSVLLKAEENVVAVFLLSCQLYCFVGAAERNSVLL